MFVIIGMVPERTATRLIYLELVLHGVGGVVGTMHHLYFSGSPAQNSALGAFFSAMEVVPLILLTFEAWRFVRLGGTEPGEAAMMGVYGMLAIGFFVFVVSCFVPRSARTDRAMKCSFWSLDGGLAWMVCVNLFPIGVLRFHDALVNDCGHARRPEFFARPDVRLLEWLRLPGDIVFIVGGIGPLVYLALRRVASRNRPGALPAQASVQPLTQAP